MEYDDGTVRDRDGHGVIIFRGVFAVEHSLSAHQCGWAVWLLYSTCAQVMVGLSECFLVL